MNWLDILILVLLAVSAFAGLKMGLIRAVLSLVGMVVGVLLAQRYYAALADRLSFVTQESLARVLAFALIVVAALALAALIAWLLEKLAAALMVGWLNHLGGAAFGVISGGVLLSAVIGLWINYTGITGTIADSRLAGLIVQYFPVVGTFFTG